VGYIVRNQRLDNGFGCRLFGGRFRAKAKRINQCNIIAIARRYVITIMIQYLRGFDLQNINFIFFIA